MGNPLLLYRESMASVDGSVIDEKYQRSMADNCPATQSTCTSPCSCKMQVGVIVVEEEVAEPLRNETLIWNRPIPKDVSKGWLTFNREVHEWREAVEVEVSRRMINRVHRH